MQQLDRSARPEAARNPAARPDLPRLRSRDLLKGSNLVLIDHGGETYFLRMTRNNRLILTK